MLQKLKVWGLRKYYRLASARAWRHRFRDTPTSTLQIPAAAGPIATRVYAGEGGADKPLIVYFHGGGWVIGDLDTHHPFCQNLCQRSGCTVVAVAYRLAPEHTCPAALDDCVAAVQWLTAHVNELPASNGQFILAGDSAGAQLATCTCLQLDTASRSAVIAEILLYPVVDHYTVSRPSYVEHARGHVLTASLMRWFWDTYLGARSVDNPEAIRSMPLRADNHQTLPATFIVTAEFDPLRDEGRAYAQALRDAGVPLTHHHFASAAHGFACSEGPTENYTDFMDKLTDWLAGLPPANETGDFRSQ